MSYAVLHIERAHRLWNSRAVSFSVEVDGRPVGSLRDGGQVDVHVTPGRHLVQISVPLWGVISDTVPIEIAEGQTMQMVCEPTMSLGRPVKLQVIDASRGLPEPTNRYRVLEVRETHTSDEPMGIETRLIENPSRSVSVTRTIRVNREWVKSYEIANESTATLSLKATAGPEWLSVEGSVSGELKRTYSLTETSKEEFAEELVLQIGPASKVQLGLQWKRIWQHGVVRLQGPDGVSEVPYRVVRAITFDQIVTDA